MSKRFILRLCVASTLLFLFLGGGGLRSQASQPTNTKNQDASVNAVTPIDPQISKYAVGDFDRDNKDEVAVDFGASGIWLYDDEAGWTQLSSENPEALLAADQSVLADLGSTGLWMWNEGAWSQLSAANVESMAYDGVLYADFGELGFWQGPNWTQLSGANADSVIVTMLGESGGGPRAFVDYGPLGLWQHYGPSLELSGANADYIVNGAWWVAADFGALGLWQYKLSGWLNLTGADPDFMISAKPTGGIDIEQLVCDFGSQGLWLWNGLWTQLSGENAEFMASSRDLSPGFLDALAVDFGPLGLWSWDHGTWSKLTDWDPEYLISADITDITGRDEILADFGAAGLWMWNEGVWSQISPDNPD